MVRFGLRGQHPSSELNGSHPAKEAFRVLRTNLLVTLPELDNPIVVVTSARAQEGKTTTCVSLAQSLAAAGSRVALVDLDLRNPTSHELLGARKEGGVADVLLDRRPVDDCLQYVQFGMTTSTRPAGMCYLSAGTPVDSPAELLSTPRVGKLLERLAAVTTIVLVDAPPVLDVADALVIGRSASGAVLVVEANRTPLPAVKKAKDALTRNQTRLLGVVLNKFKPTVPPETYGPTGSERRGA